jgi:hypothetical protein
MIIDPSRVPSGALTADAHPPETTPATRLYGLETQAQRAWTVLASIVGAVTIARALP